MRVREDTEVAETLSLSDLVMADVDRAGSVIGVEILKAPADVTAEDLGQIFERFPELRTSASPVLAAVGIRAA